MLPRLNILLLIALFGMISFCCVSTRHNAVSYSPEKVTKSDKILLAKIPGAYHYENFKAINKIAKKKDLVLHYYPEREYDLKTLGISSPLDSQYFDLLQQNGYKYILAFHNLKEKPGEAYRYYTDTGVEHFENGNPANETKHRATITLLLISLESNELIYKNDISTNLGAFIAQDKSGEHHVNVMAVEKVTTKAIKKGFKKMLKDLYVE